MEYIYIISWMKELDTESGPNGPSSSIGDPESLPEKKLRDRTVCFQDQYGL